METKKSIRDISSSNSGSIISDIVSDQKTSSVKAVKKEAPSVEEFVPTKPKKNRIKLIVNKILNIVSAIRPIYLISLIIILALALVLILVPSPKEKDPAIQAAAEAEMVKKELSKHMILPDNQQIDIRKITSKVEDPFFQNAEIGDYLIIFYENRIAYIYSIEKGLIINSGVVFIDPKTATTTNNVNN